MLNDKVIVTMSETTNDILLLGIALAIGLLIGIERGWEKRATKAGERVAGLRTFGLIGLLGGITGLIVQKTNLPILGFGLLGLTAIAVMAYVYNARRDEDVGITTIIAILLTYALGALAVLGNITAAAAAAVVTAMILGFKPVLHNWLTKLEEDELHAALKLLLISVVLLPILPDQGYGPWQALNPYELWWMVVLISGISFVGYFAIKIAGTRKGVLLTALFAGLASSTALTLHFSRLAKIEPDMHQMLSAGILMACATMLPRMVIIASVINPNLTAELLIPAAIMTLVTLLPALIIWHRIQLTSGQQVQVLKNPLELKSALSFGALLALVVVLSEALKEKFGESGLYFLSAASGIMDVDAINLTLSRMTLAELSSTTAVTGIIIAGAVNSIVKGALAGIIGGAKLGTWVAIPLCLAALAGITAITLLN